MIIYRELTFKQAVQAVVDKKTEYLYVGMDDGILLVKEANLKLTDLEGHTFFLLETQEETESYFTDERMKEYAAIKAEVSN